MGEGKGYSETKAFAYVTKVSNEKPLQTEEILAVARKLPQKEFYLDIGAGVGDISFEVAKEFKKSILIEPGDKTFKILHERASKHKESDVELIKSGWDEFYAQNKEKYRGKIDLITHVHVVYFLKPLKEKLKEMLELLSPKGKLAVICAKGGDQEKDFVHWFRHKITGTPLNMIPEFANLDKAFPGKATFKDLVYTFRIRGFDLMEKNHLSPENEATNYFLKFSIKKWFDELTAENKKDLITFLEPYRKGEYYYVPTRQRLYVIRK